jgi:MPBQ/MSBQ methyltransferase
MDNAVRSQKIGAYYETSRQGGVWMPFDRIGFLNVGYWKGVEDSIEIAQIKLMETLVTFFDSTDGTILDVACGNGASTKFLAKYFDPKKITGINISEHQLNVCKVIAPECNFQLIDATDLNFADASFDNVLCIEAAFHFFTRYRFFEEAHRVLKPGGRLVLFEGLEDYDALYHLDPTAAACHPKENYLPNLDAYRESLLKAGFRYARVDDCSDLTAKRACAHVVRVLEREFARTRDAHILERIQKTKLRYKALLAFCMACAIK